MINKTRDFLDKYTIKNKNVIIAFSGGPDSCALALVLNKLKKEYNLNIVLAYFNHNWRIKEAKEEENFTINFANKYKLSYEIGVAPLDSKKTEETARDLRYDFLNKVAKKNNSNTVFLAHNKNDNIETLIYRVIKGTSIKGLCSIPENRDIYYRPFLDVTKEEIYNFLNTKEQEYKIDSSNFDSIHLRNLIRNEILPSFEKINPNYISSISNLINNAIDSRKIINKQIDEIKKEIFVENIIKYDKFVKLSVEFRYEIINDFLCSHLKNRDFKTIKKIDEFILKNNNSRISINSFLFLVVKNNKIYLEKNIDKNENIEQIEINSEGEYSFKNILLKIKKVDYKNIIFPKDDDKKCYLSLSFPLTLRNRNAGDVFSPFGLKNGKMKLKNYLINEKIEQKEKDNLILLCNGNEICWILGKKISEKYKVQNENCFELSYIEMDKNERY